MGGACAQQRTDSVVWSATRYDVVEGERSEDWLQNARNILKDARQDSTAVPGTEEITVVGVRSQHSLRVEGWGSQQSPRGLVTLLDEYSSWAPLNVVEYDCVHTNKIDLYY